MISLFKPRDFNEIMSGEGLAKEANRLLNDWLASEGKVVYGQPGGYWMNIVDDIAINQTHQAILIDIKPIEKKCEHGEFVRGSKITRDIGMVTYTYICEKCDALLKPTGWSEIEGD